MIPPHTLLKSRYRIVRQLGEGGMANVYLGHDLQLGRDVAIKTLRPQYAANAVFRARFEREARAAASLSHPNIIDVFDVGEAEGIPFLVMELVRGQSLKAIIAADAPFHPDDVAELVGQVAAALDYAHGRGYVHRDVKPGNILIDEHGRARVVDFGIAKGLADSDLTETGTGLGTVGYLSPEQAEGLMATPASDVYSTGIVAFEMLTGRLPFHAETPIGVAMRHINDPPPPPSGARSDVPTAVDTIILRALEKDPTRRWPSVGAFARALRNWREGDAPSQLAAPPVVISASSRSSRGLTFVVILLVVAALAILLWVGFRGLPADERPPLPTVPVPAAPTVTGGIETEVPAFVIDNPEVAPTGDQATDVPPTPSVGAQPAPTIAPVAERAVVVPNLQGLTIAASSKALLSIGLRIALSQPAFSESVPMNAVVTQDPPAGATVSEGTTIRVSLSRGRSPFAGGTNP
jgi:tRNA A-37 threonylcarbamoyl transferase component Bud32